MNFRRNNDTLTGIRLAQCEYIDQCGWRAARYRWYLDHAKRNSLCEIGLDLARVLLARVAGLVAGGISLFLVQREYRRAASALAGFAMLVLYPKRTQPGALRKVFRYTYDGFDKRRDSYVAAL